MVLALSKGPEPLKNCFCFCLKNVIGPQNRDSRRAHQHWSLFWDNQWAVLRERPVISLMTSVQQSFGRPHLLELGLAVLSLFQGCLHFILPPHAVPDFITQRKKFGLLFSLEQIQWSYGISKRFWIASCSTTFQCSNSLSFMAFIIAAIFMMRNSSFLDSLPEEKRDDFIDPNPIALHKLKHLKQMLKEKLVGLTWSI